MALNESNRTQYKCVAIDRARCRLPYDYAGRFNHNVGRRALSLHQTMKQIGSLIANSRSPAVDARQRGPAQVAKKLVVVYADDSNLFGNLHAGGVTSLDDFARSRVIRGHYANRFRK